MSNLEAKTTENLPHQYHQDIDDDDDQANSSHKIIPTIHKPTASGEGERDAQSSKESSKTKINQSNYSDFNVQNLIQNDLKKYVNTLIPKDYPGFVQCHVKRNQAGITKGFAAIFTLSLDGQDANSQIALLSARKQLTMSGHAEYFIGIDFENSSKNLNDENSLATLKGLNMTGSEYVLYDHQNSSTNDRNKQQSVAIIYDERVFGSNQPTKFTVLLGDAEKNIGQIKENETIIDEWRSGRSTSFIQIHNKTPTYDEKSKTYTLNLYGNRVKLPSHKNFQLITSIDDHNDNVIMQFGRIDDSNFALDYRYPLTALQAFAIALSCFHNRLHS
ncbi:unnamed protein product [Rotaria sp. Silwood1]|nr:unnamed protein product [Rotaria sp. Silwood1]CAF4856909.1 unnamed protein product [Rotaria sp. Silwood1]